jgi:hypothetical protein
MRKAGSALVTACLAVTLASCGGSPEESEIEAEEDIYSEKNMWCGGSMEALFSLELMQKGKKPVDRGALGYGEAFLRQLAEEVDAPAQIRSDIDTWKTALGVWEQSRADMPPNFQSGRLIEPDTAGIDGTLMAAFSRPTGGCKHGSKRPARIRRA